MMESHVFIQVACIMTNEELVNRQELDLLIACMATFVALFIFSFIDYIWQMQKNDYIEWDVKTVTSSDYTVEVDIGNEFYNKYKAKEELKWLELCDNFCTCCDKCD